VTMADDPKEPRLAPRQQEGETNSPRADTDEDDWLLLAGGLALLPTILHPRRTPRNRSGPNRQ
jgi:hypothetical protein